MIVDLPCPNFPDQQVGLGHAARLADLLAHEIQDEPAPGIFGEAACLDLGNPLLRRQGDHLQRRGSEMPMRVSHPSPRFRSRAAPGECPRCRPRHCLRPERSGTRQGSSAPHRPERSPVPAVPPDPFQPRPPAPAAGFLHHPPARQHHVENHAFIDTGPALTAQGACCRAKFPLGNGRTPKVPVRHLDVLAGHTPDKNLRQVGRIVVDRDFLLVVKKRRQRIAPVGNAEHMDAVALHHALFERQEVTKESPRIGRHPKRPARRLVVPFGARGLPIPS